MRPAALTNARGKFKATTDVSPVPGRISRADVATSMVGQLTSDQYLRKMVLIGG